MGNELCEAMKVITHKLHINSNCRNIFLHTYKYNIMQKLVQHYNFTPEQVQKFLSIGKNSNINPNVIQPNTTGPDVIQPNTSPTIPYTRMQRKLIERYNITPEQISNFLSIGKNSNVVQPNVVQPNVVQPNVVVQPKKGLLSRLVVRYNIPQDKVDKFMNIARKQKTH